MLNYKLITRLSLGVAIALLTSGCVQKDIDNNLLNQKEQKIVELQKKLNDQDGKIAQLKADNATAMSNNKKADENAVSNSLVPPNAKVGECYAKVLVPELFENETKSVLLEAEKTDIVVTPATYKVIDQKVNLRGESTKIEIVPAVYDEVVEEILLENERTELVTVPATYKTIEEKILLEEKKIKTIVVPATYIEESEEVLLSPAHTAWKKGRGEIEKVDNSTGDIMCLVNVPAKYQTVTKKVVDVAAYTKQEITPAVYKTITSRVVDVAAHTEEKTIPAIYKTITKKVLKTPATTKETTIPAICKLVKVKVVDTPSTEKEVTIPAVYEDYTMQVKTADSYLRWQPILCETNTKPDIVSKLQSSLKEKGYDIDAVNGVYNANTKKAVSNYQEDNYLSTGALTLKTLETLGLQ